MVGTARRLVPPLQLFARGKVHVEVMPEGWQVNGDGLAMFVRRLPRVLRGMLGPDTPLPRTMFTDRPSGHLPAQPPDLLHATS